MASNRESSQTINVVVQTKGPKVGLIGVVVGFVGIFVFSIVLSPLAVILGLIAFLKGQIFSGIFAFAFGVIGLLTSPTLWAIFGIGALVSIPFLDPAVIQSITDGVQTIKN